MPFMPRKSLTDALRFISRCRPAEQDMRPARLTTEGDSLLFPAGEEAGELGQSSLFSSCRFLKHQPLGISSYFSRGSMKILSWTLRPKPSVMLVKCMSKRSFLFFVFDDSIIAKQPLFPFISTVSCVKTPGLSRDQITIHARFRLGLILTFLTEPSLLFQVRPQSEKEALATAKLPHGLREAWSRSHMRKHRPLPLDHPKKTLFT